MKRLCLALAVGVLLLLVTGVGTATANPPATQGTGQLAGSDQDAGAAAGTAQQQPSNDNSSVRVLSPGDDGDVSQLNEATSNATATNLNATEQSADQTQAGGSGLQAIGQSATNDQDAFALGLTAQEGASNENAPVRVLSKGDEGDVTQSNIASSDATAGNANYTGQTADQEQSGDSCKCGSGGDQLTGQSADSDQKAAAIAATAQEHPSNTNVSVRVLSPGDNGAVTQTNEATSDATAGNLNATEQTANQTQTGDSCKCGGGEQVIGQSAESDQKAAALSATVQEKPKNTNVSVRVLSPGDDGPVTQTNSASSDATAGNLNVTKQTADQEQAGSSGSQAIGQSAKNDQTSLAGALTVQKDPSNENISVRVLSPGSGGSVTQSNVASSNAAAGNINGTEQTAKQTQTGDSCKCKGGGEQLIGQKADSEQDAVALAGTFQVKPSNENHSVRVLSKGDDGSVEQTNEATSNATAGNLNGTKQTATQAQGGSGLQVIGQSAKSDQDAFALGLTAQLGASNENAPVRVLSKGDGGDVAQSNVASSDATAGNLNATHQTAAQRQAGDPCKCGHGEQLIGQSAESEQGAAAIAATFQVKPSNTNHPVRVLSKGDDGSVSQANEATSDATAANLNVTKQTAEQAQAGSGLQAIGQSAKNAQGAFALGLTLQLGASNENAPVRVLSPGDGGSVSQANIATSNASAGNANWTEQTAGQVQGGNHCCGSGIQAIGQLAENHQGAIALAATVQLGLRQPCVCKDKGSLGNSNTPTRVKSPGDDGSVRQANIAESTANAANWNAAKQTAFEMEATRCKCMKPTVQAVGQLDKSDQLAVSGALGLQLDPKNTWSPDREKSPGSFGDRHQVGKVAESDGAGNRSGSDQSIQKLQR